MALLPRTVPVADRALLVELADALGYYRGTGIQLQNLGQVAGAEMGVLHRHG